MNLKTTRDGVDLVKQFEGLKDGDPKTPGLDPYVCPTGYVTQGYGRVLLDPATAKPLRGKAGLAKAKKLFKPITFEIADAWLVEDLARFEDAVRRAAAVVALNPNQFSALVSLVFNIGEAAFQASTLLKKLKAGDHAGAADQFLVWNKGTVDGKKVVLPGLVRRREAERQMFLREVKPLAASRTIIGAGAGLATAAVEVAREIHAAVQAPEVAHAVASAGIDWLPIALGAVTALCFLIVVAARVSDRLKRGH